LILTPCSSNFSACCTARFDPRAHAHVLMFPRSRHDAPVTEARHGVCAWFTTSRFTEGCLLHHACLGSSGPAARGSSLVSPVRRPGRTRRPRPRGAPDARYLSSFSFPGKQTSLRRDTTPQVGRFAPQRKLPSVDASPSRRLQSKRSPGSCVACMCMASWRHANGPPRARLKNQMHSRLKGCLVSRD
jgi:hypothetical protein